MHYIYFNIDSLEIELLIQFNSMQMIILNVNIKICILFTEYISIVHLNNNN